MKAPRVTLSVDAPALARGVGFFETLWVLDRRPVLFEAHLARLRTSCAALAVPGPRPSRVRDATRRALAEGRRGAEYGMRWSYLAVGKDLDAPRSWRFFAQLFPIPPEILRKRRGVRAVLLPCGWERTTPRWKTIDYRASIAGARLARGKSAEEGIFLDPRGRVREGTASNVFLLSGRRAATAPISAALLPGVVRSWVLENAPRAGISVEERSFAAGRLCRGGFFTSSLTGIAAIESLDGKPCAAASPALSALRDLYREAAEATTFP
jgi:branched-subunit amino acid aminotransferase/4-amino-4-deoxychorismate lyase